MLAAPILNPIVLWSTFVAYHGRKIFLPMLLGRAGLGMVVAMIVGYVAGKGNKEDLLRAPSEVAASLEEDQAGHGHLSGQASRAHGFIGQVASDFISLGKYLVVGAAVAGALQTLVPQSVISRVSGTPVVSIVTLMALAVVLSLCSESDAFVGASFVQFGLGAQLGFLVMGPMFNTKLGFVYVGAFKRQFVKTVIVTSVTAILVGSILIQWWFG